MRLMMPPGRSNCRYRGQKGANQPHNVHRFSWRSARACSKVRQTHHSVQRPRHQRVTRSAPGRQAPEGLGARRDHPSAAVSHPGRLSQHYGHLIGAVCDHGSCRLSIKRGGWLERSGRRSFSKSNLPNFQVQMAAQAKRRRILASEFLKVKSICIDDDNCHRLAAFKTRLRLPLLPRPQS